MTGEIFFGQMTRKITVEMVKFGQILFYYCFLHYYWENSFTHTLFLYYLWNNEYMKWKKINTSQTFTQCCRFLQYPNHFRDSVYLTAVNLIKYQSVNWCGTSLLLWIILPKYAYFTKSQAFDSVHTIYKYIRYKRFL